jgi:hypothetical protein
MEITMKYGYRIVAALAACWIVAGVAYLWATGLIDSLYAYRSPLQEHAPAPGNPLGEPVTERLVFVLIDGLRLDTSMKRGVMPFLNELRDIGSWGTMHSRPPTYSTPAYSVLFTGAWPEINDGPVMNLDYEELYTWTQDNLVSAVNRIGLRAALSGYHWFEKLVPQESVAASFYTPGEDRFADREVVDAALPWIQDGSYSFIFVHLDQVDYAGHYEGGPRDVRWEEAARRCDDLLREIAAGLDFEKDTLFVSSDHGHIDIGGHGGHDQVTLLEPFVLVGAGVKAGIQEEIQMVDVAPTLSAMLGANIPAASQGRVRVALVDFDSSQLESIQVALEEQQAGLVDALRTGTGMAIPVSEGLDVVSVHQSAIDASYRSLSGAERRIRTILALFLAALPASLLYRKRGRDVAIWLGAAILFLVLFNLRYAVLDGLTYSLSSVTGATDLVMYVGMTTVITLSLAWIVGMLALKAFHHGVRQAAKQSLALVWVIIYILSLPVLFNFSLNGFLVDWRLPDFPSSFLGFLSLVQILFVGLLGPVLTGIGAMAAVWYSKRFHGGQIQDEHFVTERTVMEDHG